MSDRCQNVYVKCLSLFPVHKKKSESQKYTLCHPYTANDNLSNPWKHKTSLLNNRLPIFLMSEAGTKFSYGILINNPVARVLLCTPSEKNEGYFYKVPILLKYINQNRIL